MEGLPGRREERRGLIRGPTTPPCPLEHRGGGGGHCTSALRNRNALPSFRTGGGIRGISAARFCVLWDKKLPSQYKKS